MRYIKAACVLLSPVWGLLLRQFFICLDLDRPMHRASELVCAKAALALLSRHNNIVGVYVTVAMALTFRLFLDDHHPQIRGVRSKALA